MEANVPEFVKVLVDFPLQGTFLPCNYCGLWGDALVACHMSILCSRLIYIVAHDRHSFGIFCCVCVQLIGLAIVKNAVVNIGLYVCPLERLWRFVFCSLLVCFEMGLLLCSPD